jgi:predicted ATPase
MNQERQGQISKIVIKGFKSIKECELDLKNINVLIGANGAGKSNFISVFEMLQKILSRELALYAGKKGISPLLYNGKEVTDSISVEFHFDSFQYSYDLEWTENDSLLFRGESLIFGRNGKELLGESNHRESNALNTLRKNENQVEIPQIMLNPSWRIYQFHDTSPSSRIKSENNISNSVHFINDARNLAAFLYRLKQVFPKEYNNILRSTQLVAPFFDDFILEPKELNKEQIIFEMEEKKLR